MELRTERQNILQVVERLGGRFPHIPRARVALIVELEYAKLNGRPVRQYVPILVEHSARNILAAVEPEPAAA